MAVPRIWSPPGAPTLEEDTARDSLQQTANQFNTPERRMAAVKRYLLSRSSPPHAQFLDGCDGRLLVFAEDRLPRYMRRWTPNQAGAVRAVIQDLTFVPTPREMSMAASPAKDAFTSVRNRADWSGDHFNDQVSQADDGKQNHQILLDCLHMFKYVVDEVQPQKLELSDRLHGKNGIKLWVHYDDCYIGFAAAITAKFWFGKRQKMNAVRCLKDYLHDPRNHETFWCGVIPTIYKMMQYMSTTTDFNFTLTDVLEDSVYTFHQTLKRRFRVHGAWSTQEALRLHDLTGAEALTDEGMKKVCRGVNLTFLRVAYHIFKDFGVITQNQFRRDLPNKIHCTPGERALITQPLHAELPMFFPLVHRCYKG